ncbi:MAG: thermonuclease family protein, partial [bacterium]
VGHLDVLVFGVPEALLKAHLQHAPKTVQQLADPAPSAPAVTATNDRYSIPMGANADPADPLDKGWFTFSSVVDGDTIWVTPLQESLRLLCIDSEETIKVAADEEASGKTLIDWDATVKAARATEFKTTKLICKTEASRNTAANRFATYSAGQRAGKDRPVKFGTPYGDLAEEYCKWFFEQADTWDGTQPGDLKIRLEIEEPTRQIDVYGRYLVYTMVKGPDGKELNYEIEQVRAGMAPYFPKYGHSLSYKSEFEAAQAEAQSAKRGIWSDDWGHYTDYDERLPWWGERGETISHFALNYRDNPNYFDLSSPSELDRMRAEVGKEVTVYGLIDSIRGRSDPATIVLATGTDGVQVPIDTSNDVAIGVEDKHFAEHYVYARGTVSDENGTLHLSVKGADGVWVEPAELAAKYAAGTSEDFGEKEMATDVGKPATPAASASPAITPHKDDQTGLMIIGWQDAGQYENQGEFLVEGTITEAKVSGKNGFINFDRDFKHTFGVYVPPDALGDFSNKFDGFPDALIGKRVRVRGTIVHFAKNGQDKPEIVTDSPDQLIVLE